MRKNRVLALAASAALLSIVAQAAPAGDGRFQWSTKSEEENQPVYLRKLLISQCPR